MVVVRWGGGRWHLLGKPSFSLGNSPDFVPRHARELYDRVREQVPFPYGVAFVTLSVTDLKFAMGAGKGSRSGKKSYFLIMAFQREVKISSSFP